MPSLKGLLTIFATIQIVICAGSQSTNYHHHGSEEKKVSGLTNLVLRDNFANYTHQQLKTRKEPNESNSEIIDSVKEKQIMNQLIGRRSNARNMDPLMEMIDPKRHPKPKKPMGNDIGIARSLHFDSSPKYNSRIALPDHLEATVSIGITMGRLNATPKDDLVTFSREMHDIMDSIPKVADLHIPNFELKTDPEEEAINKRITEVARQLAENATRLEREQIKLGYIIPLPTKSKAITKANFDKIKVRQIVSQVNDASDQKDGSRQVQEDNTEDRGGLHRETLQKSGKSFISSSALPLVSHFPHEAAPLQLIGEVPQIPQFLFREGFSPMTLAPELVGPLLGGPLLKDEKEEGRFGRAHQGKSLQLRDTRQESPAITLVERVSQGKEVHKQNPRRQSYPSMPVRRANKLTPDTGRNLVTSI